VQLQAFRGAGLGYWISVRFWGQGYCTEAATATLRDGFRDLGPRKAGSRHMSGNPASGRVMHKAGMTQEGMRRQELLKDDESHVLVIHGRPASESPDQPCRQTG
jgi:RimJ/RimL family protein N-acetyltransferase